MVWDGMDEMGGCVSSVDIKLIEYTLEGWDV